MLRRLLLALTIGSTILGCSDHPVGPTGASAVGSWGGRDVSLMLLAEGGSLVYSCGAGSIDPGWTLSHRGEFSASGVHHFGGGPLPPEGHPPHPARYVGQVRGDTLRLTVTLTDIAQVLGPFTLHRGGPPVIVLCL